MYNHMFAYIVTNKHTAKST